MDVCSGTSYVRESIRQCLQGIGAPPGVTLTRNKNILEGKFLPLTSALRKFGSHGWLRAMVVCVYFCSINSIHFSETYVGRVYEAGKWDVFFVIHKYSRKYLIIALSWMGSQLPRPITVTNWFSTTVKCIQNQLCLISISSCIFNRTIALQITFAKRFWG